MHYSRLYIADQLAALRQPGKLAELTLQLGAGDSAWHPDSTRSTYRQIEGPLTLTYLQARPGTAIELSPESEEQLIQIR